MITNLATSQLAKKTVYIKIVVGLGFREMLSHNFIAIHVIRIWMGGFNTNTPSLGLGYCILQTMYSRMLPLYVLTMSFLMADAWNFRTCFLSLWDCPGFY
jgi:hypothetical protein